MTLSDAKKQPSTEKGNYVVVWQKQADGVWKVVRDVPVSDPPEGGAK
jgi:ketosteroid isomerase-like protein